MLYKDMGSNDYKEASKNLLDFLKDRDDKPLFNSVVDFLDISDISVLKLIKDLNLEDKVKPSRKKLDVKLKIVDLVLKEPYEHDMTSLLNEIEGTNHNQIIKYLEEEDIRELVPTKYGKIEHKVLKFIREHSGEYSTQEVIDVLGLNRKTFYKIYNSHPEEKHHFRTVSKNCKNIKDLIDFTNEKMTANEIAEKLNISTIVVKNNIESLGYENKIKTVKTLTERIIEFLEENPNKFDVKEVANKLDLNYNTVYKVIQRHKLHELLV